MKGDFLCEMRFYVQNNELQNQSNNKDDQQIVPDDEEEVTPAKVFNDKIVATNREISFAHSRNCQ